MAASDQSSPPGLEAAPLPPTETVGGESAPPVPRVQRIVRLRHPGVLREFAWPSGLRYFSRRNLIYGWNGSGKTTLSEVFRALEERRVPATADVKLEANDRSISGAEFPGAEYPVRVFNRLYVRENVFPIERGPLPLILVLGRESVDKQKRVEELKIARDALSVARTTATEKAKEAERRLDQFCIERGECVRTALRSAGTNPYNSYNKSDFRGKAKNLIASGTAIQLGDSEYERTLAQAHSTQKPPLTHLDYRQPDLQALWQKVADLRGTSVSARIIESLKADASVAQWVHEGVALHRARDSANCLYCQQPMPAERQMALDEHFSTAYTEFQDRLAACDSELREQLAQLGALALPKPAELHADMIPEYEQALARFSAPRVVIEDALAGLRRSLAEKRDRPFDALSAAAPVAQPDGSALTALADLLDRHNRACAEFDQRVADARSAIETHVVAVAAGDYVRLDKERESANEAEARATKDLEDTATEIATLERDICEHQRPAEELNADLCEYLGHGELQLAIGERGYTLMRDGQPATGLSEGEETAFALLYFLKSLEDRGFELGRGLVVLDDPVSSLDANALYLAFGFIQHRVERAGQLIVLTHNFSFFRQVRRWLVSRENKAESSLYMLELSCAGAGRRSDLRKLDPLLADFESEYHYLFCRVLREAWTGGGAPLEDRYVLPNVARRLMEAFLAFRRPNVGGGFEGRLLSLPGDRAKKIRVLRFLHAHSHGEGAAEPEHDLSHLAEAPATLQDLLDLIEGEDSKHFEEMTALCARTQGRALPVRPGH